VQQGALSAATRQQIRERLEGTAPKDAASGAAAKGVGFTGLLRAAPG
jgi:hypothetical protein